nr:hypothetical protein [PVC group bacterium]
RVYVASDKYLLIFDTAGDELFRIKLPDSPNCLAVDENGKVYLGMENHVVVYNADLKRKSEWPQISPNSIITSIAVSSNRVFVADAGMFAVYCFDKLGSRIWKTEKGSADKNFRGFVIPSPYFDLALDSDGYLWVVNPGKHEFCSFNSAGTLRSSWHNTSISLQGFSGCCNPTHFAFLSDDSIVTSEKGIVRVKVHGPSGAFSTVVASPAKFSEDTVGLDLAVDSKQNIWILDPYTSTLRLFAKKE